MKHKLPSLDGLKVFEAAARHLSFSKAADELCITKGAVSYQIKRLEQQTKCLLFRRTVRQVYLTESGQLLFKTVQKSFQDLSGVLSDLESDNGYDISIAATTYVAVRWLSPRVAKFLQQHPEITIHFDHTVNNPQFSIDNVDLAIMWGRCADHPDRNTRLEIPMPLYPACNPTVANALAKNADYLNQITLLYENRRQDLWLEWFGIESLVNPIQVIEDANVRVQAAIDGQGLILADAMMQNELDNGLLVAPFEKKMHGYGYLLKSQSSGQLRKQTEEMLHWLIQEPTHSG